MAEMTVKVKKGATQLWEDFSKFVDDVFKWIEELFRNEKKLEELTSNNIEGESLYGGKILSES